MSECFDRMSCEIIVFGAVCTECLLVTSIRGMVVLWYYRHVN